MSRLRRELPAALLLSALVAAPLAGASVRAFLTQSADEFRAGELDAISVDPLGILRLAHRAERLTTIDDPFLLSAAELPDGWVVGTGNAGRVWKVDRSGKTELLFTTEEPEVFAVWADARGAVYAGSSPDGKVYRHQRGQTEVLFEPGETYIWSLLGDGKDGLLVGTGTEGKLYRVGRDGSASVLYDSDDTHVRSLARLGDSYLVGTAGKGLVLRIDAQGHARTLYDAAAPEVVAFAVDASGGAYFAALASEASLVDLSAAAKKDSGKSESDGDEDGGDGEEAKAKVDTSGDTPPAGTRPAGFGGARSEILRYTRSGGIESVWTFNTETVYALSWQADRLWVGTGLEGKLYSYRDQRMVLEKDLDQSQIVAVLAGGDAGPAFATTNGAALYRFIRGMERRGTLTSPVLDAGLQSGFGTLHWRGSEPEGTTMRFSARAGMSALPDTTWTDWTEPSAGREIPLGDLERSRYLQWRVELESTNDSSPELHAVEIPYLQVNQRPQLDDLTVLDPGQILVPATFNPQNQAYEPAHPNRDGIFTTLAEPKENRSLKPLWKLGYRTLRWSGKDANDDKLRYSIEVRRAAEPEGWLPVVDDLEDERYSFDATVLPDGAYRFRVTASDADSNRSGDELTASRTSEEVVIDHSPPSVTGVERVGDTLRVSAEDPWSIVREAVWSADAGAWEDTGVDDGLLDSRHETLVIVPPPGARVLLLRLTDSAHNIITYDLSARLGGAR